MSQREEILQLLHKNGSMTQGQLAFSIYGDKDHAPNIYSTLVSLVNEDAVTRAGIRPSYYSLSSGKGNKAKVKSNKEIPDPSESEVDLWLKKWDSLEDYTVQENAIDNLFRGEFKSNDDIQHILIKSSVLNDFYSTNIFKVYPVAKHILSLNIDERLEKGDTSLVDDIARITLSGKNKYFYSFASKYCSHHNPDDFPIYDSYVHKMLTFFKTNDAFCNFKSADLKQYDKFKTVLIQFKHFYHLDKYGLKLLDKYLWQLGKDSFPKKYRKEAK